MAQLWHKRTMGPELDLKQASRETLPAVIAEQRGVIAQMGKRVEGLEARLSGGGPEAGMRGHKPAARRKKPAEQEKKPRKKRPHGFARTRMEPTRRVVHAPESCPECRTTLTGGWVQWTREVIGIPAARWRSRSTSSWPGRVCYAGNGGCPKSRCRALPRAGSGSWGQSGQSDHHPAGRGAVAGKDNPMVSANGPPVETERWGHRPDDPPGSPTGRTGRSGRQ